MQRNAKLMNILEWGYCIVIAIILAIIIRSYVGTTIEVKQSSMYPTLKQTEKVIMDRRGKNQIFNYSRGDIVVFESPKQQEKYTSLIAPYEEKIGFMERFFYYTLEFHKTSYIKRVIALPGEHITIENNKVWINGEQLQENYLKSDVKTEGRTFCELTVPDNCLFVMGDNRKDSMDSRNFGCIPAEKLEGKVWIRLLPFSKIRQNRLERIRSLVEKARLFFALKKIDTN